MKHFKYFSQEEKLFNFSWSVDFSLFAFFVFIQIKELIELS